MLHAHGLIYFFTVDRGPLNMARNLADLGLSDTRSHIPRIFGTHSPVEPLNRSGGVANVVGIFRRSLRYDEVI